VAIRRGDVINVPGLRVQPNRMSHGAHLSWRPFPCRGDGADVSQDAAVAMSAEAELDRRASAAITGSGHDCRASRTPYVEVCRLVRSGVAHSGHTDRERDGADRASRHDDRGSSVMPHPGRSASSVTFGVSCSAA